MLSVSAIELNAREYSLLKAYKNRKPQFGRIKPHPETKSAEPSTANPAESNPPVTPAKAHFNILALILIIGVLVNKIELATQKRVIDGLNKDIKTMSRELKRVETLPSELSRAKQELKANQRGSDGKIEALRKQLELELQKSREESDKRVGALEKENQRIADELNDIKTLPGKLAKAALSITGTVWEPPLESNNNKGRNPGSTFWVKCPDGEMRLLTNFHVAGRVEVGTEGTEPVTILTVKPEFVYTIRFHDEERKVIEFDAKPSLQSNGKLAVSPDRGGVDLAFLDVPANIKDLFKRKKILNFRDLEKYPLDNEYGNLVAAAGAPHGYDETATIGSITVSPRTYKDIPGGELLKLRFMLKSIPGAELIQHSALLDEGNSGGPLVGWRKTSDGKIIREILGINTATAAPSISIAVSATTIEETMKKFWPQENRKANPSYLKKHTRARINR